MNYIQLSKMYYKNKTEYDLLYQNRFNNESTIHIPVKINGYDAFIVNSGEITNLIADIYKGDRILGDIIHCLPGIAIEQFNRKNLIDEIKLSNDIEGVQSTRKEISALLKPENFNKIKKRLYGLVQKYILLLDGDEIPLHSCQDIRNIYNDLVLKEVITEEPANAPDGIYFRKEPVSIQGPDLKIIHNGVNPEEKIIAYMDEGLRLLANPNVNRLISLSAFHYLTGYIHPFYDGNGRLARFISSYYLSKELRPLVGYSLSYTIKKQLSKYYKAFEIVNNPKNRGDITPFILLFLNIIRQSIEHLSTTLYNKRDELRYYSGYIDKLALDEVTSEMLYILIQNTLFGEEGLSVEALSEIMEVSIPTIRNHLKRMSPDLLIISKSGNRKLYDINFDTLT